jgi:hypothetical protein
MAISTDTIYSVLRSPFEDIKPIILQLIRTPKEFETLRKFCFGVE